MPRESAHRRLGDEVVIEPPFLTSTQPAAAMRSLMHHPMPPYYMHALVRVSLQARHDAAAVLQAALGCLDKSSLEIVYFIDSRAGERVIRRAQQLVPELREDLRGNRGTIQHLCLH